ncbi:MAG: shikimate kinase [Tannerellaceae bacterium]|jgi:shikimate kinase|nr:shikimate kinase [Tannerellaceae bacterium]
MKRIFLLGYMGVGKTTLGHPLALRLAFDFVDLDIYIERRYHKTIPLLFEEVGETAFRRIERQSLEEVSSLEGVVISTGGGTPCYHNNMDQMKKAGMTVYLQASVEQLAGRIEASSKVRPVVAGRRGDDLKEFIRQSLAQREPFYTQASLIWRISSLATDQEIRLTADALALRLQETVG